MDIETRTDTHEDDRSQSPVTRALRMRAVARRSAAAKALATRPATSFPGLSGPQVSSQQQTETRPTALGNTSCNTHFMTTLRGSHFPILLALAALMAGLSLNRPAEAAGWSNTGPLNTGRDSHTATLLPNGKVLVTGGGGTGGLLASAELYDPASGIWTTTGSLNTGRVGHTATLLPNGKVLVVGGEDRNNNTLASAQLYDPASGTWTTTGSLNTGRYLQTATLLSNGKVLVAGGQDRNLNRLASAELYDPASGTWTTTGSLNNARDGHTATLLPNGKVLVAAGFYYNGGTDVNLSSAELYDPASGTWTPTGSLNTARYDHTATLLPNGKVLVAGGIGNSAELYDPASGTWTTTGSLNTARFCHTATLLANGQVLVVGGGRSGDYVTPLADAELYDPASGTWTVTGSLDTARYWHTATLLPNSRVLVTGGYSSGPLASAEVYDSASGKWTTTGSLNTARSLHTATLLPNGKVLVAGAVTLTAALGSISPASSCTIRPAGPGPRPARSTPHAGITRRRCWPMARSWSPGGLMPAAI